MSSSSFGAQMFRLRTSFSHRKDRLISKIQEKNKELCGFLDRLSHVSRATTSPEATPCRAQAVQIFNLQQDSNTLYETLQNNLHCTCASGHPCGITVSKIDSTQGHDVHIKMLFQDSATLTQVKIVPMPQPPPKQAGDTPVEVISLRREVAMKRNMKSLGRGTPKAVYALAASSIPSFGGFSHVKLATAEWKLQPEATLEKILRICRFPSGSKLHDPDLESTWLMFREEKKPHTEAFTRRGNLADKNRKEASDHNHGSMNSMAILDLCSVITSGLRHISPDPNLGYLESRSRPSLCLSLDPQDQVPLQRYKIQSFEDFINTTPRRDHRLRVGCAVVMTILNLGATNWVPTSWSAKDLFLVQDPTSDIPHPYFYHASLRSTLAEIQRKTTNTHTRKAFLALGVLLLELIHGDKLEHHPYRAALMGPDDRPNQVTDLATALLWQQDVEDELGDVLANAVKRCLVCMFDGVLVPDLNSTDFVRAAWQQVVDPIEKLLLAWNNC